MLEIVRVLLIKLRCNSGEHVDLCAEYTRRSQSMFKSCECPGCWVDCYGQVEVLYSVHGVVLCKKYILKSSDKLSSSHNNSSHGRPTRRCTVAAMINTRLVIL